MPHQQDQFMTDQTLIYKITPKSAWREAEKKGVFEGAAIDLQDGYIHFSSRAQTQETADKHFAAQTDLLLVAVKTERLGDQLKWEVSRGGDLFPHLYSNLDLAHVEWVRPMPLDDAGKHVPPFDQVDNT